MSKQATGGRTLVVAAHPDDEVLGCGATIARLSKRGEVTIGILGEGITSRFARPADAPKDDLKTLKSQARSAARILGARQVLFADQPDNRFDTVPLLELVKTVESWISQTRAQDVYTHHAGDLNVDHAAAFRAVLTATRPVPGCSVENLYAFEVPSATEWSFGQLQGGFQPNVFDDVSRTLPTKIKAMECYARELRPFPHPRSARALEAAAARWGSVAGMNYAEPFVLVRSLRRR